ncbi:MAG: hypothetical protein C0617_14705 [Desulfuromonas sp.]|uniref:hypothetical protein n=1 Tax=Desulfuromonas sp. TaxID=892 RepID=UPI000CC3A894|nr:hypothetical protein [Desulfuromonas sp.]PLX82362.1 MAG: hypothetical protein C0617_14705 [Desulfuromonas sp.]
MTEFFQLFQTERVLGYMQQWQIGDLIRNPWFLGGMALLCLISLLLKWRILLATVVSVTGFVGLVSYTLGQETNLESMSSDTLLVFVGGGVALVMVVIYLLFIKAD